jgi:hypothetical protein
MDHSIREELLRTGGAGGRPNASKGSIRVLARFALARHQNLIRESLSTKALRLVSGNMLPAHCEQPYHICEG